ncbi:MAG: hypothetical protein IAG10_27450, partial [Planctomycetaceae bacterium]|nr:hypothetical protein [Planctomycetaceae bacterium]
TVVGIDDPFLRMCTPRATDSDGEVAYETTAPSKPGTYYFRFYVDGKVVEQTRITVRK